MGIELTGGTGSHYREIKEIIDPIIDATNTTKPLTANDKESLKEKIANAVDRNFNHLSLLHTKELGQLNKNITIEEKSELSTKEEKQLPIINNEIVEMVEEYSDLLKEFENVDVHELFRSSPHIEEIAEQYLREKTGKAEFFEALKDNPGALAGFLIGLKLINDQIEANKTFMDSAKDLISSGLDVAKDVTFSGLGVAMENLPSPAQAAVVSTVSAFQAFKEGNNKLGAIHCLGVVSIAFCASYDLLFEHVTTSTQPSTNLIFDAMYGLEKLNE